LLQRVCGATAAGLGGVGERSERAQSLGTGDTDDGNADCSAKGAETGGELVDRVALVAADRWLRVSVRASVVAVVASVFTVARMFIVTCSDVGRRNRIRGVAAFNSRCRARVTVIAGAGFRCFV